MQRTPGLSEILRGHPIEEAIRHTSLDNLDFITGGKLGEDPGELLMAEFPNLLHQFERMYDMVVIDTTPLVPVSDARIIARFGKATLIVASAGTTTRRQLRTAVERLALISVQPTGAVLNNYRAASKTAYYGPSESSNGSGTRGKRSAGSPGSRRADVGAETADRGGARGRGPPGLAHGGADRARRARRPARPGRAPRSRAGSCSSRSRSRSWALRSPASRSR